MEEAPPQRNLVLILARAFAAQIATAVFLLDEEGTIIYYNEAAERLTESVILARERPAAKVIFTGGVASLVRGEDSTGNVVGSYLRAVGISRHRILLEGASRTTHENAVNLARLLDPKAGQTYVLVTSAYHMPRAVGTFRQHGFEIVAWPVDYRTIGPRDMLSGFGSIAAGLERVDLAFKEWIGLLAYWASGRSDALWPGPGIARGVTAVRR